MEFKRYSDIQSFREEAFAALLEDEVKNNIQLGIITGSREHYSGKWLLATVKNDDGCVLITATCTPPFSMLIYETKKHDAGADNNGAAVRFLADELKRIMYKVPSVLAERELARRFAAAYAREGDYSRCLSMNIMRLEKIRDIKRAPGGCRELQENDMFFVPYWERAFSEDCRVEAFSIEENARRIRTRLGKGTHLIWEDGGVPVSQAVHGRSTINGAVINSVYTPPFFRNCGYAASVVAELSERLLNDGKKFCCLFADEANPISRSIYYKIGYNDVCVFDEIRFR